MLHVAVCAGLRVSELVGLQINDVTLPSMSIRVHGKGRRERAIPLWKATATALRAWLAIRDSAPVPEVFVNARGGSMSRWGFAYVLKRHVETARLHCPSLANKQVSPMLLTSGTISVHEFLLRQTEFLFDRIPPYAQSKA